MQRSCRQCSSVFDVSQDDLAFLERVSPVYAGKKELIPPPTLCPDCRQRRRMAFRNQIHVYLRPSAATGEPVFSMFDAESPLPVLGNEEWWEDGWDELVYGRVLDFGKPFLTQLQELRDIVPCYARSITDLQNSDYSNNASHLKNCYFTFHTSFVEDCMYSEMVNGSRDCIDCTYTTQSELCYGCTWSNSCYRLLDSEMCENCSDSIFLRFCNGCRHCFGCVNLRHQEYCVFNEQKSKEEYEDFVRSFRSDSFREREQMREKFHSFAVRHPVPHMIARQTEGASGNMLQEVHDVFDSYFAMQAEHLRRCFSVSKICKDCSDYTTWGDNAELLYECASCGSNAQHLLFCYECFEGTSNLLYCMQCIGCSDCFGCVSLKKKRYCILNKQYTQSEYEVLVPKIIAHMRTSGEWGEFFPISLSPVAYNHTIAQRYYPKTRQEVAALGGRWIEEQFPEAAEAIEASTLLDGIPETDDPIIVKSARSGRPFKITSREIQRYRAFRVPLPRLTYDERMEDRAAKLGGIRLYDRVCAKTGKPIKTTIPPEAPWIVWERGEWEREFGG